MMDYLLVEHKDRCWDCDLMRIDEMHEIPFCGRTGGRVEMDSKPDWCPLLTAPRHIKYVTFEPHYRGLNEISYIMGFNDCIDLIIGGNE